MTPNRQIKYKEKALIYSMFDKKIFTATYQVSVKHNLFELTDS